MVINVEYMPMLQFCLFVCLFFFFFCLFVWFLFFVCQLLNFVFLFLFVWFLPNHYSSSYSPWLVTSFLPSSRTLSLKSLNVTSNLILIGWKMWEIFPKRCYFLLILWPLAKLMTNRTVFTDAASWSSNERVWLHRSISIVRKARAKSAPGGDGVTYKVFKHCDKLRHTLFEIQRALWKDKEIVKDWCRAEGVYLPMEQNAENVGQFWPISIINVACKIFMGILAKRTVAYTKQWLCGWECTESGGTRDPRMHWTCFDNLGCNPGDQENQQMSERGLVGSGECLRFRFPWTAVESNEFLLHLARARHHERIPW